MMWRRHGIRGVSWLFAIPAVFPLSGCTDPVLTSATRTGTTIEFVLDPCRPAWHKSKHVTVSELESKQDGGIVRKLWEISSPAERDVERVVYGVVPSGFEETRLPASLASVRFVFIEYGEKGETDWVSADFELQKIPSDKLLRVDGTVLSPQELNRCS